MDAQTISANRTQQEMTVQEAAPVQKAAGTEAVTPEKVSPASTAARPKYDQYIPEQPKESCGLYQPVTDEKGDVQIKFDAPTEEAGAQQSGTKAETGPAEQAKPGSGKKPELSQPSGKVNSRLLETRKKRLEQQIKSCGDSEKVKELKKKLAQVKRELSAAKG